jgi:hypothetical protein
METLEEAVGPPQLVEDPSQGVHDSIQDDTQEIAQHEGRLPSLVG